MSITYQAAYAAGRKRAERNQPGVKFEAAYDAAKACGIGRDDPRWRGFIDGHYDATNERYPKRLPLTKNGVLYK